MKGFEYKILYSTLDNAAAESFMKALKVEEVYLWEYQTLEDVHSRLPYFIEQVYDHKRPHSALGYRPREEFEVLWTAAQNNQPPCRRTLIQREFPACEGGGESKVQHLPGIL